MRSAGAEDGEVGVAILIEQDIGGFDIAVDDAGMVGGEQCMASFSVAVNRKNSNGLKQTLWVRVNCWNKLADVAAEYVRKGSMVQVTTEWMRPSSWVDQSGTAQASVDLDATSSFFTRFSSCSITSRMESGA